MPLNTLSALEVSNLLPEQSNVRALPQNSCQDFWQLWESYQDYFYKCCLKWMRGNSHDAEEVLSQAMLKAWNEWQKSANTIQYPKAWLTRLIYNVCMDMHRKYQREAPVLANIDDIKFADHPALACRGELPESKILHVEMRAYLYQRIRSLSDRLRHPFILHYDQEKSYKEIAKQLALSEENVRKRLFKARSILQKQLRKYLAGEDDSCLDSVSLSLKRGIPRGEEEFPSQQAVIGQLNSSIPTNSKEEEISYKVTVLCQETVSHHWYSSTNLLVWR
jgi:RNA polymerase sigma-70 factor (ECF subfamily)